MKVSTIIGAIGVSAVMGGLFALLMPIASAVIYIFTGVYVTQ